MLDRNRFLAFFVFVGLFSLSFVMGTETEVPEDEARKFLEEFEAIVKDIDAFGIFLHNAAIALPMFVPGFGVGWGLFAAWQTGVAFSAFKTINPMLSQIPALSILYLTPFGLMELAAYAIGMSRSFLLIFNIYKKISIKKDKKIISIEVGIVVGLLLIGGIVEAYMVELIEAGEMSLPEI